MLSFARFEFDSFLSFFSFWILFIYWWVFVTFWRLGDYLPLFLLIFGVLHLITFLWKTCFVETFFKLLLERNLLLARHMWKHFYGTQIYLVIWEFILEKSHMSTRCVLEHFLTVMTYTRILELIPEKQNALVHAPNTNIRHID